MEESFHFTDSNVTVPVHSAALQNSMRFSITCIYLFWHLLR